MRLLTAAIQKMTMSPLYTFAEPLGGRVRWLLQSLRLLELLREICLKKNIVAETRFFAYCTNYNLLVHKLAKFRVMNCDNGGLKNNMNEIANFQS